LAKIRQPVLDLYGSQDLEAVIDGAEARKRQLRKAGNPGSRQDMVQGANHFFQGLNEELTRRVRSWLNKYSEDKLAAPATSQ
jgi:hypothetical protein